MFIVEDFVGAFSKSLSDGDGGVLHTQTHPPAAYFGATEEGVREGGVAPVYPADCESVLFTHKSVGALFALASEVVISEVIAVKALMSTTI